VNGQSLRYFTQQGVSDMTLLAGLFDIGIKPKRKKSIYLNKAEKDMKRRLANQLGLYSFRGYKNWFFSYQHDDDIDEYDNVNQFIKAVCNGSCFTESSYYITAELSLNRYGGTPDIVEYVHVDKLLGGE